ncbi:MAG: hypothetical protein MJ252_18105 [archaeon]|nr:hypothetical protein [archaeon]
MESGTMRIKLREKDISNAHWYFNTKPKENVVCTICHGILQAPVKCLECGDNFCSYCYNNWENSPSKKSTKKGGKCEHLECERNLDLISTFLKKLKFTCRKCGEDYDYSTAYDHYQYLCHGTKNSEKSSLEASFRGNTKTTPSKARSSSKKQKIPKKEDSFEDSSKKGSIPKLNGSIFLKDISPVSEEKQESEHSLMEEAKNISEISNEKEPQLTNQFVSKSIENFIIQREEEPKEKIRKEKESVDFSSLREKSSSLRGRSNLKSSQTHKSISETEEKLKKQKEEIEGLKSTNILLEEKNIKLKDDYRLLLLTCYNNFQLLRTQMKDIFLEIKGKIHNEDSLISKEKLTEMLSNSERRTWTHYGVLKNFFENTFLLVEELNEDESHLGRKRGREDYSYIEEY